MTRPSSSTSDAAWLQAMLDVEASLARVHARRGTIPEPAATAIVAACGTEDWDAAAVFLAGEADATPVTALVRELRRRVGEHGDAVHVGATSQDVVDTAAMLVVARTLPQVLADADAVADACAQLAAEHRDTPILARTLLQQALPTAFGLKAAGWLSGIGTATAALRRQALPVQLAGPVGHGDPELAEQVAADLGLHARALPWQADRTPVAQLAAALGVLAGALAKPCRDVVLLSQTEVAEVAEADAGQSSAMPHKRNPAAAVQALAAAHRTPGLVATLLAGMAGEHERAAGVWQAERPALTALLDATADTARFAARSLGGLRVDAAAMAAAAGDAPDLGSAGAYVDRALHAHQEARR